MKNRLIPKNELEKILKALSKVKTEPFNRIECEKSANKVINDMEEALKIPSKTFTFAQLSKISDDNYGVLNRCINMSSFKSDDVFILTPVMYHRHGFGKPIKKHLRTQVSVVNGKRWLATQDLTLEQWKMGQDIEKAA